MGRFATFACITLMFVPLHAQTCIPRKEETPTIKPPIHNVVFQNAFSLSEQDRRDISENLHEPRPVVSNSGIKEYVAGLADEATERAKAAYENNGYFDVQIISSVRAVEQYGLYDIVIRVLKEGKQYRLGELRITHASALSEWEIRSSFPLHAGEIFSREKIAEGLEQVRRLYGSQGYINATFVPTTVLNQDTDLAELVVNADEGKQFRVRTLDVIAANEESKENFLTQFGVRPGDVYTPELWDWGLLGSPGLDVRHQVVSKKLDERGGWIDLVVNLEKLPLCPIDLSVPSAIKLHHSD